MNTKNALQGSKETLGDLPKNTTCIVCEHVFSRSRPVLFIAREEGFPIEFMCGKKDHFGADSGKVIGLGHLLEWDNSLSVLNVPRNGTVLERRDGNDAWQVQSSMG
ncbi:hypothetical protein ACMU_07115 [Actibacterium mucosum KCTC 23349]|uniref:Uncharacterized protein n=1 Tax=Actibacterium mucosum KCTC 23349 TaxID=1454373 RepID=A0A037ZKS1_9RHOB|nr:hypothetical protein [Actibacterium mucosum]KAJ56703.1 hypothetical protein ACMU_07115 [Actibacterium mucosum KCTC 23349]